MSEIFERLTARSRQAIADAEELARQKRNPQITPRHLLAALLSQTEGLMLPLVDAVGAQPALLKADVDQLLDSLPSAYGGTGPAPSRELTKTLKDADRVRSGFKDDYLSVEHLLLAVLESKGATADLLHRLAPLPAHVISVEPHRSRRRHPQAARHLQRGCLAAAIRPQKAKDLPRLHRQIQPADGVHFIAPAAAECLAQRFDLNGCFHHRFPIQSNPTTTNSSFSSLSSYTRTNSSAMHDSRKRSAGIPCVRRLRSIN